MRVVPLGIATKRPKIGVIERPTGQSVAQLFFLSVGLCFGRWHCAEYIDGAVRLG